VSFRRRTRPLNPIGVPSFYSGAMPRPTNSPSRSLFWRSRRPARPGSRLKSLPIPFRATSASTSSTTAFFPLHSTSKITAPVHAKSSSPTRYSSCRIRPFFDNFTKETESHWRLVETAWEQNISAGLLDIQYSELSDLLYIDTQRFRRRAVTSARAALNGYQKGKCSFNFSG